MNRENQVYVSKNYYDDEITISTLEEFALAHNIPEQEVTAEIYIADEEDEDYDEAGEEVWFILSGYRPMTQEELDDQEYLRKMEAFKKQKALEEEQALLLEVREMNRKFLLEQKPKKLKEELDEFAALSKTIEDSLTDPEHKKKEREEFEMYKRLRAKYLFVQDCKENENNTWNKTFGTT